MATLVASGKEIAGRVLEHLLGRIDATPALQEPFSHIYLEEVFPADVYEQLLSNLPNPEWYTHAHERYAQGDNDTVRSMYALSRENLAALSPTQQELFGGVASALTAPEVKRAMYTKLARDLAFRYGVPESQAGELAGYSRPTLYRE